MRGTLTALAAATLMAVAASPAQAMTSPACSARLTATALTTVQSCSFDNQYDYATITVVPSATVTATTTCRTTYGYTYTSRRTVSKPTSWAAWTPGHCTLSLAGDPGTTAVATATPTFGPIIEPYPVP